MSVLDRTVQRKKNILFGKRKHKVDTLWLDGQMGRTNLCNQQMA